MSWDADLVVDGAVVFEVNYTHNCNGMANAVLERFRPGYLREVAIRYWSTDLEVLAQVQDDPTWTGSWWQALGDMTGKESLEFFDLIVGTMMETPEFFREMNPKNGWGDFDSFLATLREMRDFAAKYPDGKWRVSG